MNNKLITLYKQDGRAVKVNEESLATALSIGWSKEKPAEEKPKGKILAKK